MIEHIKKAVLLVIICVFFLSCENSTSQKEEKNEQSANSPEKEARAAEDQIIMFFGNSITAGYGLEIGEAFPALIQRRLDSLGYPYKVVNAGLSGETTAGGLNRIEWVLRTIPDIFVLELGANDGLRGLDLAETKKNLKGIIDKVRDVNPEVKIILAGMMVPPNMGSTYAGQFESVFPQVAEEADVALIPFILDKVAGEPELNQDDGIHPTAEGHRIVAINVWEAIQPFLEREQPQ